MRLQFISDLHETYPLIEPQGDYIALLGDVTSPFNPDYENYLYYLSSLFKGVFVVMGNHEYYGNIMNDTNNKMNEMCNKFSNVFLLNNSSVIINGYLIVGSTLWSNTTNEAFDNLNCGKMIKMRSNKKMDIIDYLVLHDNSVKFIQAEVSRGLPTIILTHYAPLHEMNGNSFNYLTSGFSSDLSFINSDNIIAWLSGHTHNCLTIRKNGILYSSNCLGQIVSPRFNTNFFIDF